MKILIATGESSNDYLNAFQAYKDKPNYWEFTDDNTDKTAEVIIWAPSDQPITFSDYQNLELIHSTWAGVEKILPLVPEALPLCRLVDHGLEQGMSDYVLGHILADQQDIIAHYKAKSWNDAKWPNLSSKENVVILGAGNLGQFVGSKLKSHGFHVTGFARTTSSGDFDIINDFDLFCHFLTIANYVVNLLPATKETHNFCDDVFFSKCNPNALFINAGRGETVNDEALIQALSNGFLRHAILDVFREEPLPDEHVFWYMNNITITPHIAAKTRIESSVETIIENIASLEKGEPLQFLVDKKRGY